MSFYLKGFNYKKRPAKWGVYYPPARRLVSQKQEIIHLWMKEDLAADQIAAKLNITINRVVNTILKHEHGNARAACRSGGLNAKFDKRDSA